MKKLLLMIVITIMAFTSAFAQQGDRANQDGQKRNGSRSHYSSHHSSHYSHRRSYHRRRDNAHDRS